MKVHTNGWMDELGDTYRTTNDENYFPFSFFPFVVFEFIQCFDISPGPSVESVCVCVCARVNVFRLFHAFDHSPTSHWHAQRQHRLSKTTNLYTDHILSSFSLDAQFILRRSHLFNDRFYLHLRLFFLVSFCCFYYYLCICILNNSHPDTIIIHNSTLLLYSMAVNSAMRLLCIAIKKRHKSMIIITVQIVCSSLITGI